MSRSASMSAGKPAHPKTPVLDSNKLARTKV
jgi:hypothetical protein